MLVATAVVLVAQPSALPDGPGKAEFERVCSGCHDAAAAVTGSRRSRAAWEQIVADMVVRGAEGSDEELALVVAYLSEQFGPSSRRR
ncbi:MAG: cytochrome c [Vicinamibacterales bacterium]